MNYIHMATVLKIKNKAFGQLQSSILTPKGNAPLELFNLRESIQILKLNFSVTSKLILIIEQ